MFKGTNTSSEYIKLCVHLSPNTQDTHACVLLWQQSEIWTGTAVLGCINYKKIMNQRKGKSVCMQKSVCSLGILPSCLLNCEHVSVCARAQVIFGVCAQVCV